MKQLFRGGLVVNGTSQKVQDILTENGKILAVGEHLDVSGAEVTDISGRIVFPGFIDSHTHMHLEVSDTVTADKFDSGSRAAIAGGTTCLIDFATQNRGETLAEALQNWHKKTEGGTSCDYAFHLAISGWSQEVSKELEQVVAKGIHSFKLYMTYDAMVLDDQSIYEILARLGELGAIAGVHCENRGIIDARLKELWNKKGGRKDIADYPDTRPALAEAEAVGRLLKIAKCAGVPVIIVHLSSAEGYEEIRRARAAGQTVYVETCPQYLLLDDGCYRREKTEAMKYMIAPPLRKHKDREVLWRALLENEIHTIATDHCSFTTSQKRMGMDDFSKTPCGMPGIEERPALMYHYGVSGRSLTLGQMCRYLAENPAKLYQLYPQKGVIAPGSDADLVIWNPDMEWTISARTHQSASDYNPYEGTKLRGRAEKVYLRGTLVAENGNVLQTGTGRYIPAGTSGNGCVRDNLYVNGEKNADTD